MDNSCRLGLSISFFITSIISTPAYSVSFEAGELTGSVDTTLTYGSSFRVNNQDRAIIGSIPDPADVGLTGIDASVTGTSFSENADNGNQNYNKGIISSTGKFTTEVSLNYRNFGFFSRFNGFRDYKSKDAGERTALSDKADRLVTENLNLQDLYVWRNFNIGAMPASIRIGEQVLSWGESTFIQNGINIINPFDVSKLRTPGSQIKDALVPVGIVNFSISPTDNLSFDAYYQYDWERTIIEPVGSYFSTNDFVGDGGDKIFLGFGAVSDRGTNVQAAVGGARTFGVLNSLMAASGLRFSAFDRDFLAVKRIADDRPENGGEFGFALKYYSEKLNDTEFGFHFINHHSRTPIISARTGSPVGVTAATAVAAFGVPMQIAAYAQTANYFIEYPEDIQRMGLSFNTQVKGIAFQGEYTLVHDAPLQVDDIELMFAALCPINGQIGGGAGRNQVDPGCANTGTGQIIRGFIERDVSQFQVTATKVIGSIPGANQAILIGEVGMTHVHDMPSKTDLRLNAPGTFVSGNASQGDAGGLHAGRAAEDADHFADATSWGVRMAGRLTYNNLVGSLNISPRFALSQDVSGITPGPGGNFLAGRRAITLGVTTDYQNVWRTDLSYTSFQGAGRYNLLNDRDFVAFSMSYFF